VNRKASRKRRSVKRKASRKRRSVKRKASRKSKSAKRKASRKRKSAKRKSRKRKSVTKSHKFRIWSYIPFTQARSDRLADQKVKKQQQIVNRKTYKEYLQPLIKNYSPGHPQSLYDAVAKYYIEHIAHVPSALRMLEAGKPIPMKFPPGYSIDKYKKVNKLKIGQAYRLYYRAMHKAHLEDCRSDCIKSRSQFITHHINKHTESAESTERIAATKSLYEKCLKNTKRISKATPGSDYSKFLVKAQADYGCTNLPDNLKTKIINEIRMEAKVAKRVKQGKFARWSRSLKKNEGAAVAKYQQSDKYKQYKATQAQAQATIPWEKRTPAGQLIGCRKGLARFKELQRKGSAQTPAETAEKEQIRQLYKQRGCTGIINNAKTAPAKPAKPASLF
jgi:hypothetical protein